MTELTDDERSELTAAQARGSAFLTEHEPNWQGYLDTDALDMGHWAYCVLYALDPDESYESTFDWSTRNGFNILSRASAMQIELGGEAARAWDSVAYSFLTALWTVDVYGWTAPVPVG